MFVGYYVVSVVIGFVGDDCDFGYCCFVIGEQQFCVMFDDVVIFLIGVWQKVWYVDQCQDWNFKGIVKVYKLCGFVVGIDVQIVCQYYGLIGDDIDGLIFQLDEVGNDVFGEIFLDFVEIVFIC